MVTGETEFLFQMGEVSFGANLSNKVGVNTPIMYYTLMEPYKCGRW